MKKSEKVASVVATQPTTKLNFKFSQENWEVELNATLEEHSVDLIKGTVFENLRRYVQAAKLVGSKGLKLSKPIDLTTKIGEATVLTTTNVADKNLRERLKMSLNPIGLLRFQISFNTVFDLMLEPVRLALFSEQVTQVTALALESALAKAHKDKKSIPASLAKIVLQPERYAIEPKVSPKMLMAAEASENQRAEAAKAKADAKTAAKAQLSDLQYEMVAEATA
jgi:hypothetical protein